MTSRPRSLPRLAHGDGSLGYDADRRQVTLRHMIDGRARIERADPKLDPTEAIAAVKRSRDARRAKLAEPTSAYAGRSDLTVDELLDDWLPFITSGKAENTRANYRWTTDLIREAIGPKRAATVTPGNVERLLLSAIDEGYGEASLKKLRGALGRAFKHGVKHHGLASNPVAIAETPDGAAPRKEWRWFDEDEYPIVRAHLVNHHTTMNVGLLTMLLAGLRSAEAIGLRWEHVRLDERRLDVETAVRRRAKGEGPAVTKELKTDKSGSRAAHRTLPMPTDLVAAFRRERTEQLARGRSEYVLARADGSHFGTAWFTRGAAEVSESLGLDYINPTGYRHSFASMLVHRGMALTLVAKLLGHANVDMVAKTYAHSMVDVPDTTPFLGSPIAVAS